MSSGRVLGMNSRKAAFLLLVLLVLAAPWLVGAETQTVFRAKVVRIEPWLPIKITCGIALVTRLAEYEVTNVYHGHIEMRRIIVRHLACNGDELDNLQAGDEVIVVVRKLKRPENHVWRAPLGQDNSGREITVQFDAVEVAKQVYPTTRK
jgi:hypothetical protein